MPLDPTAKLRKADCWLRVGGADKEHSKKDPDNNRCFPGKALIRFDDEVKGTMSVDHSDREYGDCKMGRGYNFFVAGIPQSTVAEARHNDWIVKAIHAPEDACPPRPPNPFHHNLTAHFDGPGDAPPIRKRILDGLRDRFVRQCVILDPAEMADSSDDPCECKGTSQQPAYTS